MAEFRRFDSRDAASIALADHIASALELAVEQRRHASLVVCGGSSPLATFRYLRQKKLPWQDVTIVPSDERLVPVGHVDSNEGMIRRELMQEKVADAQFLSLAQAGLAKDGRIDGLKSKLSGLAKPIDIVLLGMGADGHTASLFPNSPDITDALNSRDPCVIQRPPHLEEIRLSLTPEFLLDAREIVLLIFGDGKRGVYDRAISSGSVSEFPIRFALRQKQVPVSVYWAPK